MLLTLLARLGADVVGGLSPVAESVHLDGLEQEELFVGAPVGGEYGRRDVVYQAVRVRRLMRLHGVARSEALQTEVEVFADGALDVERV